MNNEDNKDLDVSKVFGPFQIFLLVLIIVGVVLLITQNLWVSRLSKAILNTKTGQELFPRRNTATEPAQVKSSVESK